LQPYQALGGGKINNMSATGPKLDPITFMTREIQSPRPRWRAA
jgi:hypothetical protein